MERAYNRVESVEVVEDDITVEGEMPALCVRPTAGPRMRQQGMSFPELARALDVGQGTVVRALAAVTAERS